MKLHMSVLVMVMIWSLLLTGCRDRYFSDRGAAVKYLEAHQQDFEQLAEAWAIGVPHHPTMFCNFDTGGYRWGKTFIRKVSDGFTMEDDGKKGNARTIVEASKWAGVPYASLSYWVDVTAHSKIYCIQDNSDSTVQIMLAGSEWSPYGFRYAPKNNVVGLKALTFYSSLGGMDNSDRRMEPVLGRWFYFEAKR